MPPHARGINTRVMKARHSVCNREAVSVVAFSLTFAIEAYRLLEEQGILDLICGEVANAKDPLLHAAEQQRSWA